MQGDVFTLNRGSSPLLLSQPHVGLEIPPSIERRLTEPAKVRPDTDWHIDRLYRDIAEELDATVVTAKYSRYVIDLNRDPDGASRNSARRRYLTIPSSISTDWNRMRRRSKRDVACSGSPITMY